MTLMKLLTYWRTKLSIDWGSKKSSRKPSVLYLNLLAAEKIQSELKSMFATKKLEIMGSL